MSKSLRCSAVILASRENASILIKTLGAVAAASEDGTQIDVIVNGNPLLLQEMDAYLKGQSFAKDKRPVRLWGIQLGDKANAFNEYFYRIFDGADLVYFVDGYARPYGDSFRSMARKVMADAEALGGSGVPSTGRTAKWLRQEMAGGGIHGNLFCIKGETVADMTRLSFRIPVGFYKTDATIGSFLYFNMNPAEYAWSYSRILVDMDASWETDEKRWWRWSDVKSTFMRRKRRAQGDIENKAFEYFITKVYRPGMKFPDFSLDLIKLWKNENPKSADLLIGKSRLHVRAYEAICQSRPQQDPAAQLVFSSSAIQ